MSLERWYSHTESGKEVILRSARDNGKAVAIPPTHTIYSTEKLSAIESIDSRLYYNTVLYNYSAVHYRLARAYNSILVVPRDAIVDVIEDTTGQSIQHVPTTVYIDSRTSIDSGVSPQQVIYFYATERIQVSSSLVISDATFQVVNVLEQEGRCFYQARFKGA